MTATRQFEWNLVKTHISNLGVPSDGTGWEEWFRLSWQHITEAGLADFGAPSELAKVKVRIMALCWIAQDFCAVSEFNIYYTDIRLSAWMQELNLAALDLVLVLQSDEAMAEVSESSFFRDNAAVTLVDDNWYVEDEVYENIERRSCFAAVQQQRICVVDALLSGFGGALELFASMFAVKHNSLELRWQRKEELWEIIDELQSAMDNAKDVLGHQHIELLIQETEHDLSDESLQAFVAEQLKLFALGEPVGICDEVSNERLAGYMWCSNGCPTYILVGFAD